MNRKWALILVASLFADEDDMLRCVYCRDSVMECLLAALDQSYSIQLNYLRNYGDRFLFFSLCVDLTLLVSDRK